jgi:hypothetical protein
MFVVLTRLYGFFSELARIGWPDIAYEPCIETSFKKYGQIWPNMDFYSTFLASSLPAFPHMVNRSW